MKTSDFNQVTVTVYRNTKPVQEKAIEFFKGLQYRWEHTPDPEREDEKAFLTQKEALQYAENISLELGFYPKVERISILQEDLLDLEIEAEEEFELDNFISVYNLESCVEIEDVWTGELEKGDAITGAVIIQWSWEKHVGYARNLLQIGIAGTFPFHEFERESDLLSGNEDSTFKPNYSVLLTASEVAQADDLKETVFNELNRGSWKWNYFKNNPETLNYEL
tara:strand:+ start:666 stop:1331 length:666 start_codon:yes stop_codon:yes gene_type:complete